MSTYSFGWAGPVAEEKPFDEITSKGLVVDCRQVDWDLTNKIMGYAPGSTDVKGKRHVFWDSVIKMTGKHLPNTNQLLGDCVAAGTEMGLEYQSTEQIVSGGRLELYRPIYRPWLYGAGRVFVGKNRISGDGSVASWQMDALVEYGVLPEDLPGLPQYSTSVGREWGRSAAVLQKWAPLAKTNRIKKYIRIKSFDDAANVIINLKLCPTIASSRGFDMKLRHDTANNCSWFVESGTWQHLMHLPGLDYNMRNPRIFVGNQWGYNAHPGQLDGPNGGGWVSAERFDRWVKPESTYCYAAVDFDGWDLELVNDIFKMR